MINYGALPKRSLWAMASEPKVIVTTTVDDRHLQEVDEVVGSATTRDGVNPLVGYGEPGPHAGETIGMKWRTQLTKRHRAI